MPNMLDIRELLDYDIISGLELEYLDNLDVLDDYYLDYIDTLELNTILDNIGLEQMEREYDCH